MNALAGLMNPAAVGQMVQEGFDKGEAKGEKMRMRRLLAEHARNPADPGPVAEISAMNPELGMKLVDRQRQAQFSQAAVDYYNGSAPPAQASQGALLGRGGMGRPQMPTNALAGVVGQPTQGPQPPQMNALAMPPVQPGASFGQAFAPVAARGTPPIAGADGMGGNREAAMAEQPAPAPQHDLSVLGQPRTPGDAAFVRMLSVDPKQAFAIDSEMRDRAADRLKIQRDAYGFAVSRLGGVTDAASYDAALADIAARIEPLGVEITDHLPQTYPGPDGIKELRLGAIDAKDQVSLFMQEANIEADNARADRNTDSLIGNRDARLAEQRRATDERIATTRRGQDLTDKRVRSGGGKSGGSPRETIRTVRTPEEARKLPSGTKFRTPDGSVKIVP